MMKEGRDMKILQIENSKGYFSLDGKEWNPIDEINKENLMRLLNLVLKSSTEMDEYTEESIGNQVHQIIYKSIYEKLAVLQNNKDRFIDKSDRLYQEAIEKYQK